MFSILGIIVLIMVGIIAYFHFVQGFFSATISAIIAVLAAVLSIGYQETIVDNVLKGKMGDSANAVTIVVLFVVVYVILRIIFDKSVPGNVRFPSTFDKIGAALMGIVAGCFAAGVFAIAVQTLPFGPSVGGYAPYDLAGTQHVIVPGLQQQIDSIVNDQMKDTSLDPTKQHSMVIPVTDIVLGTVNNLSDGGTLAGDMPLASVHPDYMQELFGDRIGIQVGAKFTAMNNPAGQQVKLDSLYSLPAVAGADGEVKELRNGNPEKPSIVRPTASQVLLVARLNISHDAADDTDKIFRFSPGSIHLVANQKDYYPIGLMDQFQGEPILMFQRPDDFLFLDLSSGDAPIDVVFLVDKEDLYGNGPATDQRVADGRFITVKRLAMVDLSGATVDNGYNPIQSKVLRKGSLTDEIRRSSPPAMMVPPATPPSAEQASPGETKHRRSGHPAAAQTPSAAVQAPTEGAAASTATPSAGSHPLAASGSTSSGNALVSPTVSYRIGVTTNDENAQNLSVGGGTVSLKDSRLASVKINPAVSLDQLGNGDSQLSELYVPDGKKLVQVSGSPTSGAATVSDASGTTLTANGFACLVNGKLMMHFDYDRAMDAASIPPNATAVVYLFVVPSGTHLTGFSAGGQTSTLDLTVP